MKRLVVVIALLSFISSSAAAATAGAGNVKIGVVDMRRVLIESKAGKVAETQLKNEVAQKRTPLLDKQKVLKAMTEDFKAKSATITDAERKTREVSLASGVRDYRAMRRNYETELRKSEQELTYPVIRDVSAIVKKIGADRKYTVILTVGAEVLFHEQAIDITDEVLKIYDAQYAKK